MPETYAAYAPRPQRSAAPDPGGFAPPTYNMQGASDARAQQAAQPPAPQMPPVPNGGGGGFQPYDPNAAAAGYGYPGSMPQQPSQQPPHSSAQYMSQKPPQPSHQMHASQSDFAQLPPQPMPPQSQAFQSYTPGYNPQPYQPGAPAQQAPPPQQLGQAPPVSQAQAAAMPAMPAMMAGLQQMTAAAVGASAAAGAPGAPGFNPALGAQLFQTFAPGAAGYTAQMFGEGQERVRSFMRMPKYYFAVNHRYVLRKLSLILMPFVNRTWSRQRGMDPSNYGGSPSADGTSYLPPRDDVNAPDLYIPVMAFMTYVMVVGFVFGVRNAFKADVLANSFSKGLLLLSMEVLIIKLGLYLINARPTPWLDVIAYRGYKFVGIVLTIVLGIASPKLHTPVLLYSATAMGIFLMRSHRRIILPRDVDNQHAQDLARRNAFLLFLSVLQYPIYWFLASVVNVK